MRGEQPNTPTTMQPSTYQLSVVACAGLLSVVIASSTVLRCQTQKCSTPAVQATCLAVCDYCFLGSTSPQMDWSAPLRQ